MTEFKLSRRSLANLEDVEESLQMVVHRALKLSTIDFGVIEGLRTEERQKELVESGASQTMNSKHLTGKAVDLLPYVGPHGSWELPLFYPVADAMFEAARELGVSLRWGGAWHVPDILRSSNPVKSAYELNLGYIKYRLHQGAKPFIDAPHFELA